MKASVVICIVVLFMIGCSKQQQSGNAAVKYTTAKGRVFNTRTGLPMANVPMAVYKYLHLYPSEFVTLDEGGVVTTTTTDDSGYYSMTFADTIKADSFYAESLAKLVFGTQGMNRILLDRDNTYNFYLDTFPYMHLHFHVINNHDTLHIYPDVTLPMLMPGFDVTAATFDTTVIWNVVPNSQYDVNARYYDASGAEHDNYYFIYTGNYQLTYYDSITVDASKF